MSGSTRQSGFTLIEMITVIILLGIVSVTALGRFRDISSGAENAQVDTIFSMVSNYLNTLNGPCYALAGQPGNGTSVTIDGLSVRFRNGKVRVLVNNAHVPVGTPNRNNQATRFWYMMFAAPPPVIRRNNNTSSGWAVYNGPGGCGVNSSRCWKYRNNGVELAVITYEFINGSLTLTKNF